MKFNFDNKFKFLVLAAACFQQLVRAAIITGSTAILSVYYSERFQERALSAAISAMQIAVTFIFVLPAMIASKRFGTRLIHICGAILCSAGLLGTAFTTEAWQALLTVGIAAPSGTALIMAASFTAVSNHFPGTQLAPYAAMTASLMAGVMISPNLIANMMESIGFTNTFIVCAIIMSLNIVTGISFKPAGPNSEGSATDSPKISLKIQRPNQGIFYIESAIDVSSEYKNITDKQEVERPKTQKEKVYRLSKFMQLWMEKGAAEAEETGNPEANKKESGSLQSLAVDTYGNDSVADLMKERNELDDISSLKQMLTSFKVLHFMAAMFLTSGGYICFLSIIGDYSTYYLHLSSETYTTGLTISGVSQTVVAFLYILLNRYFEISSLTIKMIASFALAMVSFVFLTEPSAGEFYILMAISGTSFGLYYNATYGCGMEVTSPEQSNLMYGLSTLAFGVASCSLPYLSAYLQTAVDYRSGLALSGGVIVLGGVLLLPLSIKTLCTPKSYSSDHNTNSDTSMISYA